MKGIFCSPYLLLAWSRSSELSLRQNGCDLVTPKKKTILLPHTPTPPLCKEMSSCCWRRLFGQMMDFHHWGSNSVMSRAGLSVLLHKGGAWCCPPHSLQAHGVALPHKATMPLSIPSPLSLWLQGHRGGSCHNKACNNSSL